MVFLLNPPVEDTACGEADKSLRLPREMPAQLNPYLTGCCPNHFSLALKHFLINLRLVSGDSKTRPSGLNSWNRFSYTSPRFISKKRFNERSKRFSFGQQPVNI
jgi:hypothetical protein